MDRFLQTLLDALAVGSLYALIALGYTMVYGILKFINFAHSDIFVLGAWISFSAAACVGFVDVDTSVAGVQLARVAPWVFWLLRAVAAAAVVMALYERVLRPRLVGRFSGWPATDVSRTLALVTVWGAVSLGLVFVARRLVGAVPGAAMETGGPGRMLAGGVILLAAMMTCGLVGFCLERLAYKPLRKAPRLNVLITAIGVSLLLQNLGQANWMFGTRPQGMPKLLPNSEPLFSIGDVKVWPVDVMAAVTAVGLMVGLDIMVYKTKLGRAMRAVSFSERNAALMGIPVDKVISFTFVLGASLAAAAGFLYSQKYAGLNQTGAAGWVLLGLKAFVAAVVGGIGNIRGAMLGGLLIAGLEFFGAQYISTELRDVYVFAALIVVLLFRPSGILGRSVVEKV